MGATEDPCTVGRLCSPDQKWNKHQKNPNKQTQEKAKCKTNPKNPQAGVKPGKTEFVQNMLLLELPKLLQSTSEGVIVLDVAWYWSVWKVSLTFVS